MGNALQQRDATSSKGRPFLGEFCWLLFLLELLSLKYGKFKQDEAERKGTRF